MVAANKPPKSATPYSLLPYALPAKRQETPARPHRGRRLRQQQIERFAMKHFNQPECSTKTIAAALNSVAPTCKKFLNSTAAKSERFILRQRLRKADHLIAKGAEEDDQLAKRCGFADLDDLKAGRAEARPR